MKKINFFIVYPSELSAGIVGFTDEITIEIDSGDPGGDKGEFEQHMLNALRGWYDGAKVSLEVADNG